MSNFSMYELQDNSWDVFNETDDHIVPNAGDDCKEQSRIQGDNCKKSLHQLQNINRSTDSASTYVAHGKDMYLPNLSQKERMQEKGSWSQKSEDLYSSCNSDPCKELKVLTSDNTRMSDHFKSSNVDSSSSQLCADNASQTDNDLSFLDSDLWLEMGNFEDVDRALNCDLPFGMESLNNEVEEFCWLSSSHGTEGSDDALKSGFKFSSAELSPLKSVPDYTLALKENVDGLPINDSNKKPFPIDKKLRSQMNVDDDAFPILPSTFSESNMKSSNTDGLMPNEKLQGRLPKSSAGKRKNGYQENGDSVHPYAQMEQYPHLKQSFGGSSSGVTSQDSIHKHRPNMDSDSFGCAQIQTSLMHPDYSRTQGYTCFLPTLSGSRSEHNGHPSPSFKEPSYTSNRQSSHGHPLEAAAVETNDRSETLYNCCDVQQLNRGFRNENMAIPMPSFQSPSSAQLVGYQFENENEGCSEVDGVSIGFSQEIDSSNVQESSSMNSALDEISLEATSFCQLQQVMDQLDIKTKLCIRDSLYRLAKSAEQRHSDPNVIDQIGDDVEKRKALMTQGVNRCTGFMDMETNTNPIDRSIAHLLFHRPSDPSMLPRNDTMMHGSMINPQVMTEKQVCQEGSSAGVENKSLGAEN